MADLYVDMDSLRRAEGRLSRITDLLDIPCRNCAMCRRARPGTRCCASDSTASPTSGPTASASGEFSEGTCEALQNVVKTFTDLDTELANALNRAQKQP